MKNVLVSGLGVCNCKFVALEDRDYLTKFKKKLCW